MPSTRIGPCLLRHHDAADRSSWYVGRSSPVPYTRLLSMELAPPSRNSANSSPKLDSLLGDSLTEPRVAYKSDSTAVVVTFGVILVEHVIFAILWVHGRGVFDLFTRRTERNGGGQGHAIPSTPPFASFCCSGGKCKHARLEMKPFLWFRTNSWTSRRLNQVCRIPLNFSEVPKAFA